MTSDRDTVERLIEDALPADRPLLRARLRGLDRRGRPAAGGAPRVVERIADDARASAERYRLRRAAEPSLSFPDDLPVASRRDEIASAIERHQCVIVCGETGSGKTTQLPKICLELGRGRGATIGHTQPRRIAARSVAERVASELSVPVGHTVGWKVRFTDRTGPQTLVKLMTDGVLLAELARDRHLHQYDTIIIDEAHERSLNIDFLLGALKRLLPRRPDLKIIVTSATIDPQRFAEHFAVGGTPAPIIEVSGRTYPVEVRYRPGRRGEPDDQSLTDATLEALLEAQGDGPGDVLIFMPGEREIRQTAAALRRHASLEPGTEILPLYARLSPEEQQRVFAPHAGRRIVIATNVAETSLTVPGVRFVIDPGLARVSRFSARSRVQGLPVEPISKASAEQRKGRCGRTGPGVCYRLYAEQDFERREPFTQPEILRTNLAGVVLQMKHLRLGEPERFPFVEPPDGRQIRAGYDTLLELGAIDDRRELTPIGRELAGLPVDPRIGRMILAARDEGCLHELLIIASGLAAPDPRDRPHERRDEADEAHQRFADERSDFLAYPAMWSFYHELAGRLSRSKIVKACQQNYLSHRRIQEWREMHRQLRGIVIEQGWRIDHAGDDYDKIHRALLAGLLANAGRKGEGHEYDGTRSSKFHLFPGSGQFDAKPAWVVAAEIVRTTRVYARCVARVKPEWIERVGAHLLKRTHASPRWSERRGRVLADERITMLGLEIVPRRAVHFGPIDPKTSRELFIHHALVEGAYRTRVPAIVANAELWERLRAIEHKTRRPDLLAGTEARFAFYDRRLPPEICSGQAFERWARRADPGLLRMSEDDLLTQAPGDAGPDRFPDRLRAGAAELPLEYRYAPGEQADGVTLRIPVAAIQSVRPEVADKLVPGRLEEKIEALMRTLPRSIRRNVDIRPTARELAAALARDPRPLVEALAEALAARTGVAVAPDVFRPDEVDPHLRMRFAVDGADGQELAAGRDLGALKARFADEAAGAIRAASDDDMERDRVEDWDFDELPRSVELARGGTTIRAYPALVDEGGGVALRVLGSPELARRRTRWGLARLLVPRLTGGFKLRPGRLPGIERIRLLGATLAGPERLQDDIMVRLAERVFLGGDALPRSRAEFEACIEHGWNELGEQVDVVMSLVDAILGANQRLRARLDAKTPAAWSLAVKDIRFQADRLLAPGFLLGTPFAWLRRVPVYLAAAERRLDRLRSSGAQKDAAALRTVLEWQQRHDERLLAHQSQGVFDPELETLRWMIEEFRIATFAQELRTAMPVSAKRLRLQWERCRL